MSNDDAYAESLFRICKYRHEYPRKSFGTIEEAREWTQKCVRWYNHEHKHSSLKFVTPSQRHARLDALILQRRDEVYRAAKNHNSRR